MNEIYLDVVQHCLFRKTRNVSRFMTNIYTKKMKKAGITPIQFIILTALQIEKKPNVNALSEVLIMDRTTVNRNLKPLIREELVIVHENEDRREKIVQIVDKGKEIYKEGYTYWQEAQKEFEEILGTELYNELHTVLDKVSEKI